MDDKRLSFKLCSYIVDYCLALICIISLARPLPQNLVSFALHYSTVTTG